MFSYFIIYKLYMEQQNHIKFSVSREINFEYQEFLNKFYGVDKETLKKWISQNFSNYFFRQLDEICLDLD